MCLQVRNQMTIKTMCAITGISHSGYYSWLNQKEVRIKREDQDNHDFQLILQAYSFKNRYKGARGIKMVLYWQFGLVMNLKKFAA